MCAHCLILNKAHSKCTLLFWCMLLLGGCFNAVDVHEIAVGACTCVAPLAVPEN